MQPICSCGTARMECHEVSESRRYWKTDPIGFSGARQTSLREVSASSLSSWRTSVAGPNTELQVWFGFVTGGRGSCEGAFGSSAGGVGVATQTPEAHWPEAPDIAVAHTSPSGWTCTRQPCAGSQNASKHGPPSAGHCMAVPATHAEPTQVSVPLHRLPSLQTIGVPAAQALFTQRSAPLQA